MNTPTPFEKPIHVTRPLLPDRKKVYRKIDEIWDSQWLTNDGAQHVELETKIQEYLGVPNVSLFTNGTLALQLACQALRLTGEVITTPFTFPATPHVLYWNNIKPVFCDIDYNTLTLDPSCIESLITPQTTAIMPVHLFGYPCDVNGIEEVANRYGLRVIYDAAHCFGVQINNKPIGNFGDISMFSFHATKMFHSVEGGALTYKDQSLKERLELAKNFGFKGLETVVVPGINAKLSELHSAIGLLTLDIVDKESQRRKELTFVYRERLRTISGISFGKDVSGVKHNYYNFVIRIDSEELGITRDQLFDKLKIYNVLTRKYFYPLCSQFPCYKHYPSSSSSNLPIAEKASKQVLSLPLYGGLNEEDIHRICDIIESILHEKI